MKHLEQLREHAMRNFSEQLSDLSINSRVNEIISLEISAHSDIEKTINSLKSILLCKKEASIKMLNCEDEKTIIYLAEYIKYMNDMLKKTLGIL